MKLKLLVLEFVTKNDLVDFLKDLKSDNPMATEDEISDALVIYLNSNKDVSETIKSGLAKILISALLTIYGNSYKVNTIAHDVVKKVQSPSNAKPSNRQIIKWVEKYSKMYGINKIYVMRLIERETRFSPGLKNYNPFQIGDKNNTLGPSYGVAQIKVPVAQELYKNEPESGIQISKITASKLQNDVQFNIKTSAKLLSHYYHKKFKHVKSHPKRVAWSATAYNAGMTRAKKYGINKYGKLIAGLL